MRKDCPWGYYQVLNETDNHKTKYIYINPNSRLSYQRHQHRSEHWLIVSGTASVTVNGYTRSMFPGDSIDIKSGELHRIASTSDPVEFIEIQRGVYFGEDDIERIEDDYGRKSIIV
jgi:mannose-6-phosphate isomerase